MEENIIVSFNEDRDVILSGGSWTYTDSLSLAKVLDTRHDRVLERIRDVLNAYKLNDDSHLNGESYQPTETTEFIKKYTDFTYSLCYYKNTQNKMQPYYKMSKDLTILVLFSFRKLDNAQELQKAYIAQFNKMEKELQWWRARYLGIDVRNNLTDAVKDYVQNADYRDYIAFTNLVYVTLFGKDAQQIRTEFGLKPKSNIRPMLTDSCLESVKKLEQDVMQFLSYDMNFNTIERMLQKKYLGKQTDVELKMIKCETSVDNE